ncbi:MerR family transcriptional regulator [Rhodosalinus halophilus]|uniref:MerR family transcriptional regulator n=1 Tax=Rhodosalinus halophilus TaxID=2259333 RepID=UPI001F2FD164|nr:MerR family transcriptional regulator [Rhodosalinus halophilus]
MPEKSPDAFRTISEVAEWLDTPAHVLRFWESKFTQVKPVKRAGGRRYYRPSDMQLIGGIKRLLHDEGMTIKGVQKLLREKGVRHVAGYSPPLEGEGDVIEAAPPASGTVVPFEPAQAEAPEPAETEAAGPPAAAAAPEGDGTGDQETEAPPFAARDGSVDAEVTPAEADTQVEAADAAPTTEEPATAHATAEPADADQGQLPEAPTAEEEEPAAAPAASESAEPAQQAEHFPAAAAQPEPGDGPAPGPILAPAGDLPSFLRRGTRSERPTTGASQPRPRDPMRVDLPPDPDDDALEAPPGPLSQIARLRALRPDAARAMQPHLAALAALQDRRKAGTARS